MSSDNPSAPPQTPRRRRLKAWLVAVPAVVAALFVLVVFVLPTPVARHVIESQLASLGIKHDGIDTIDIDLWNSRVRAGPITFGAGDAQSARIGGAGFDYRLRTLLEGRALVTTFYLRGVDLRVARQQDGAVVINGVNLETLAEGAHDEDAASGKRVAPFQAGVERFEFTDSQLEFEDVTGGVLTMALERLTLERLRTWTPEDPTSFELEARLNEMKLSIDGTVLPLSKPLRVTLNSRIEDVTLERVSRFVGPTGLSRQDGNLKAEVRYAYEIHRDGRVEGTVDGTYHLTGLDVATAAGEQAKVGEAVLKVDLSQGLAADRSATATGKLTLNASALSLATATGDAAELGSLEFAIDELDFTKLARERERMFKTASAAGGSDATPGRAPSIVELMIGWARDLGLNALRHYLAVNGKPRLALGAGVVRTAARDGTPAQAIRFDALSVNLGTLTSEAVDAGWNGKAALDAVLRGLHVAGEGGGTESAIAELTVMSKAVNLAVTTGKASLGFDLAAAVQRLTAKTGDGASLALGALALGSEGLTIKEAGDDREASGPIAVTLEDVAATGPGDQDVLAIRGRSLALDLAPFTLTETDILAARFGGSVQAEGVTIERGGASPLSVSLASAKTELADLRIAPLGAAASTEGAVTASIDALRIAAGKGADALSVSLASATAKADGIKASGLDGEKPVAEMNVHTTLGTLEASLPAGERRRASLSVAALDVPLTGLALAGAALRGAGALDARGIALKSDDDPRQSVVVKHLSVAGLKADSAKGVDIKSVAVDDLVASLVRPPASDAGPDPGADAPGSKASTPDHPVRLGTLTVSPGSRITIADPNVKPPLKLDVLIEKLAAGPIDTAAPSARTTLALAVSLNENTKAALDGWAAPLADKVDFDLALKVDRLALPLLSPYAAKMVGVDLESGVLDAGVKAKADAGALDGKIDVVINDLFVVPISDKKAQEIAASVGVPVGFAVSVLKDGKGAIELGFPLAGTLDEPKVDYSEAINKAIGGAIASVLPTGWFTADGNSFRMKPATFVAGTADLTEDGKAVADQMGKLFTQKSGISMRACGRAARDDLVALRAAQAPTAPAPAAPPGQGTQAPGAPAPEPVVAEPNEREVEALLALATKRGATIREYLQSIHGISPERIPECRTAYSIEDDKAPRAEFQF